MSFIVNSGWFWGDPHIKTLDNGNYTFNGLGEFVMIDAQNGTFQLQARTTLAQGNSTTATIFSAGAAKEENASTIEVRVKEGGEGYQRDFIKSNQTSLPRDIKKVDAKFLARQHPFCSRMLACAVISVPQ